LSERASRCDEVSTLRDSLGEEAKKKRLLSTATVGRLKEYP
jgi:hypothetical protein